MATKKRTRRGVVNTTRHGHAVYRHNGIKEHQRAHRKKVTTARSWIKLPRWM